MPNLSAVELAERAGIPLADVDRLCDLGILPEREDDERFTEGDASRKSVVTKPPRSWLVDWAHSFRPRRTTTAAARSSGPAPR